MTINRDVRPAPAVAPEVIAPGFVEPPDLLRLLVDTTVDYAIMTLDASGRVASWNPGAERIKGYTAQEIIGRHFSVFYTAQDQASGHPERELELAAELGRYTEEGWRVRRDGSLMWANVTLVALRAPDGSLAGFGKVTRDATARKEAEDALSETEARFRELAESLTDAYILADARHPGPGQDADGWAWDIRHAGGAFTAIFGVTAAEVRDRTASIADLIHPEDSDDVLRRFAHADVEGVTELEFRIVRPDGHTRWVRARYRWLPTPALPRMVALFEDVTARKAAEQELLDARHAAQQASLAKSEFLSRMSHELRTPLNAVLGFSQLLELEEQTPEVAEAAHHIRRSGEHLLNLINEVLDIARIESGRLTLSPEPVDVGQLVREAIDLIDPIAAAAQVTVTVSAGPGVLAFADRQRTRQILLNLLSNAVKYNHSGGAVEVGIARVDEPVHAEADPFAEILPRRTAPTGAAADGSVRVEVRDTGIGISEGLMPRLFQAFDRLGAELSTVEGTGVGLALSLRLAGAMGGTLTATSQKAVGSTFTLTLPAATGHDSHTALADGHGGDPEGRAPGHALRLLYVEDNSQNLHLMEAVVGRRPRWRLQHAATGGLAMELVAADPPDLILLDLHLPDVSGADVLARIQGTPQSNAVPVVVVSADATPGQITRLRDCGARDYLTKPIDVRGLLEVLDGISEEIDSR